MLRQRNALPVAAAAVVVAGSSRWSSVLSRLRQSDSRRRCHALPSRGLALVVAEVWRRHCSTTVRRHHRRRLGSVEQVAFTTFLVSLVLLLS